MTDIDLKRIEICYQLGLFFALMTKSVLKLRQDDLTSYYSLLLGFYWLYTKNIQLIQWKPAKIIYITMTQRTTKCTWKYFRTRKLILILIRRQYDVLSKYKIEFRRKVLVTENNSCKDPSHAWYDFKTRVTKCMKHI